MKFSCDGATLSDALRKVCSVIKPRNTIPVLEHLKIEASDGKVVISGTDLDTCVSVTIEASVIDPGEALLLAKVVRGLVKSGHAAFETDGSDVMFRGASTSARLMTVPVDRFPVMGRDSTATPINATVSDIITCMPFTSQDEVRFYLRGVCVDENHCIGLDGHQMVIVDGGGGKGQIIPKEAEPLLRLMPDAKLGLSETLWFAETETVTAWGKLIDGQFPDWQSIRPTGDPSCRVQADELKSAAAALAPVFSERNRALVLDGADSEITLSAQGGFGSGKSTAPMSGEIERCAINGKYLEGICAAFSGREVGLTATQDKLSFIAEGQSAIVMGMRIPANHA